MHLCSQPQLALRGIVNRSMEVDTYHVRSVETLASGFMLEVNRRRSFDPQADEIDRRRTAQKGKASW